MSDKNPSFYFRGCKLAEIQVKSINKDHIIYICMDTELGLIDHIFRFKDSKELREACQRISDVCLSIQPPSFRDSTLIPVKHNRVVDNDN